MLKFILETLISVIEQHQAQRLISNQALKITNKRLALIESKLFPVPNVSGELAIELEKTINLDSGGQDKINETVAELRELIEKI